MSEELADELEAINSIYGPGTLVPSTDEDETSPENAIYILTLPDEAPAADDDDNPKPTSTNASLRLQFPPSYPSAPPAVLGTHSAGEHGKRGAAARDLSLFRAAVGAVYEPGQVCLFDAVEKFKDLLDEQKLSVPPPEDNHPSPSPPSPSEDTEETQPSEEPPWVLSDPVVELKSTFIARCAAVSSPGQAAGYVRHLLSTDRRVRGATHNITAWRVRGPNGTAFQDCDDDGETAAGGRLLHLMQLMDLWDTMVVVTRWYGGQKLGPRRFALINAAARDAFVKAGLVHEAGTAAAARKKGGHGR
ncbi:ribosomal protein S5 domain 2-type protein [Podospora appendiculata]|uniref:Ribosomal protein S5 domain 2-type protein n=1 Tax=Podospora appendiculata TaxID=314037 RepID=A0AAE1C9T5_9PEZI|nr:ribosomal protein S5 domain 2-type protein [Podospora appendiculata]